MFTIKFYLASFIACFFVLNSFAQKQNVYFLKDDGRYVNFKDSADYVRIVREPDSGSVLYNVLEYYLNGSTKLVGKSSTIEPVKLEGTAVSYYPDKKKKQVANYTKGKLDGLVYDYYPNGKLYRAVEYRLNENGPQSYGTNFYLTSATTVQAVYDSTGVQKVKEGNGQYQIWNNNFRKILEEGEIKNGKRDNTWKGFSEQSKIFFKEEYTNGKFIKGVSNLESDSSIHYTTYMVKETLPTFIGGDEEFGQYLAQTLRYPKLAKNRHLEGIVILSYIIEKDGSLDNFKVLKTDDYSFYDEAVRVLRQSPKWISGMQNGVPVSVSVTTTLKFILNHNGTMANILVE